MHFFLPSGLDENSRVKNNNMSARLPKVMRLVLRQFPDFRPHNVLERFQFSWITENFFAQNNSVDFAIAIYQILVFEFCQKFLVAFSP